MSDGVTRFNRYLNKILPSFTPFDFRDKSLNLNTHILYFLNRTQRLFKWENLPDTIPERMLEMYLQINGNTCFYRYNDNLYAFVGGLGGEPDEYYRPTIYTIANPALKLNVNAKINIDCVVMPNDSQYMGLIPLLSNYLTLICENELSIFMNIIQSRMTALISADNDKTYESAKQYIDDIVKGKLGVIADNQFFEGLKSQPYQTSGVHSLTDLIEMQQYIKASLYNELGLNANYNMKRESINSNESQLNKDSLLPLIDDMLYNRQIYAEKVNEMFNTNITVDYDSAWKENEIENEKLLENISDTDTENGGDVNGSSID